MILQLSLAANLVLAAFLLGYRSAYRSKKKELEKVYNTIKGLLEE